MKRFWSRFQHHVGGATALEYGLLIAMVAATLVLALGTLDRNLLRHWNVIADVVTPGS